MSFKHCTAAAAVLLATATAGVAARQPDAVLRDRSGHQPTQGPTYRSVFDGYRGFTDQPVLSWRESNDLVGRIGGWQAYAREVQGAPDGAAAPGHPAGDKKP